MDKQPKDKTLCDNELYKSFFTLNNVFTLSFARRHIESKSQAEILVKDLLLYCLCDTEKKGGTITFEIQTDLTDRPTGWHIGFVEPLSATQEAKLFRNLRLCNERWRLGSKEQFLVKGIREKEEYFWKNTGTPKRVTKKLFVWNKEKLTSSLRALESRVSKGNEINRDVRQWENFMSFTVS